MLELPMTVNKFSDRFHSTDGGGGCIIEVWILSWRVIAPDDYILDITNMNIIRYLLSNLA